MNKKLISKEVQDYINANLKADLHSFLLKKSPFEDVSVQEIAQRIKGKQIAEKKFPFVLLLFDLNYIHNYYLYFL